MPLPGGAPNPYRWVVLAVGTLAQVAYSITLLGLAVVAPEIRSFYHLSLTQVGVVLAAPNLGALASLYLWGRATDRFGERRVLSSGLGTAALCLSLAALGGSFDRFLALLVIAGAMGACVNSAGGHAVMEWFAPAQRGIALGIRQAGVPIGGAVAALLLPPLTSGDDLRPALITFAVVALLCALAGLVTLRSAPRAAAPPPSGTTRGRPGTRRLWRLSIGSAVLFAPQVCGIGFLVLFLHGQRHLTVAAAGAALACINLVSVATRVVAGHWSDIIGSRVKPMRWLALTVFVLLTSCAALLTGPLPVVVPLLVLMGCVTLSWPGLSFAAAAEAGGRHSSGAAIGIQQTALALSSAVLPVGFGALISKTSWTAAFVVLALFPLIAWKLLAGAGGDDHAYAT